MNGYNLILKYPTRVPVIVETSLELKKKKFLVPCKFTIPQFLYLLRRRMKLSEEEGIYIFINNKIPSQLATIGHYHHKYHKDKILYIKLYKDNIYG